MKKNTNDHSVTILLTSLLILVIVLSYNHIEKLNKLVVEQQQTIDEQNQAITIQRLHSTIWQTVQNQRYPQYSPPGSHD